MRHWCHLVATDGNAGHCAEREEKPGRGVKGKERERERPEGERRGGGGGRGEEGSRAASKRGDLKMGSSHVLQRTQKASTRPKTLDEAFQRLPDAIGALRTWL